MSALYTEIVRGSFTLAAVATGSLIALYTYFRQKEYELVKQRYLEQSVDAITTQLETSLGTVSHNYARCLQIVKSFRDSGEHFDIKEIDRGFLDLDASKFLQIANHRVSSLLGSNIIWDVYQSAMAYAVTANSTIQREIPDAIRIHQTTDYQQIKQRELGQTIAKDLQKLHENGFKYSVLVAELHYLSRILELEKLSLKAIQDFKDRPQAKQLIAHLTAAFPRDLSANDPSIAA
jgi:hypothetical protein